MKKKNPHKSGKNDINLMQSKRFYVFFSKGKGTNAFNLEKTTFFYHQEEKMEHKSPLELRDIFHSHYFSIMMPFD